ncbi:DUF930 domain-containing protein [Paenochrobactrum sp. BZR 588]|uniref:DUF930 domain-containing protein n=1 Tax=Paenochrobactrum TaxID=999488 RepID=UPI0035BC5F2D
MKLHEFIIVGTVFFAMPANAMTALEIAQLKKLDPATRLEQRCDVEAMEAVGRSEPGFSPDKVLAYAFAEPSIKPQSIVAKGAALRSRNQWYRLSYTCETDTDRMTILSFKYKLGDIVPHDQWDAHYLVP